MIGKFLEEESKPAENAETDNFQTEEKPSADVLALPESRTEVLNVPETPTETPEEIPAFRESEEIIEPVPLPENQETYTIAPPDAIVPAGAPVEVKTENYEETTAENMRRTGLAWSAATVLVGSVIFMLIIGWFFDLVFGSSPWGIVGGIVLGAIIGFVQFFRITSQIFKKDDDSSLGFK
jgi:F0F1-type ATP synthase assembly protein I